MEDAHLHWDPAGHAGGAVGCQDLPCCPVLPLRPHASHPHQTLPPALWIYQPRAECGKFSVVPVTHTSELKLLF